MHTAVLICEGHTDLYAKRIIDNLLTILSPHFPNIYVEGLCKQPSFGASYANEFADNFLSGKSSLDKTTIVRHNDYFSRYVEGYDQMSTEEEKGFIKKLSTLGSILLFRTIEQHVQTYNLRCTSLGVENEESDKGDIEKEIEMSFAIDSHDGNVVSIMGANHCSKINSFINLDRYKKNHNYFFLYPYSQEMKGAMKFFKYMEKTYVSDKDLDEQDNTVFCTNSECEVFANKIVTGLLSKDQTEKHEDL